MHFFLILATIYVIISCAGSDGSEDSIKQSSVKLVNPDSVDLYEASIEGEWIKFGWRSAGKGFLSITYKLQCNNVVTTWSEVTADDGSHQLAVRDLQITRSITKNDGCFMDVLFDTDTQKYDLNIVESSGRPAVTLPIARFDYPVNGK